MNESKNETAKTETAAPVAKKEPSTMFSILGKVVYTAACIGAGVLIGKFIWAKDSAQG